MRKIIDSNFLQREELRAYLSTSPDNYAVLTDYAAMEAYKGDTLKSIYRSMEILAEHPTQVIVLKGTQHACSLSGDGKQFAERMIDQEQTAEFAVYCTHLSQARRGDRYLERQILDLGRSATEQMDRILKDAEKMESAFEGIAATYTPAELKVLRSDLPYTESLIEKTHKHVMLAAALMLADHPTVSTFPAAPEAPDRFIFRFALCGILLALRWISVGRRGVNPKKLRNDLVDLNFAAFGTYFDGLFTADQRLASIFHEARIWLDTVFAQRGEVVPT